MIKSIRGSDPDAALYWLARMLEGGEDVRFLARRLVILASEDVGNADPAALPLAVAAAHACELVGLPECQLTLAQAVTYLACAPKSNAATVGIGEARRDVREGRLLPVPVHLRERITGATAGPRRGLSIRPRPARSRRREDYLGVKREYYRPVAAASSANLAARLGDPRTLRQRPEERNVNASVRPADVHAIRELLRTALANIAASRFRHAGWYSSGGDARSRLPRPSRRPPAARAKKAPERRPRRCRCTRPGRPLGWQPALSRWMLSAVK